jgi:hypothetical protein
MAGRRCAEWRFPTPKQQRIEDTAMKIAKAQRRREVVDDSEAWWASVLEDPRAVTPTPAATRPLGEIRSTLLRVGCERCGRAVEIRRDDAIARFGADAKPRWWESQQSMRPSPPCSSSTTLTRALRRPKLP